jgi:hypothetical protein
MGKGSAPRPYSVDQDTFSNNWDTIFKKEKNSDDVSPHAYEYELNKSTGEVEKTFKQGIFKPNQGQFNGNVTDTSSISKDEEGKLSSGADS